MGEKFVHCSLVWRFEIFPFSRQKYGEHRPQNRIRFFSRISRSKSLLFSYHYINRNGLTTLTARKFSYLLRFSVGNPRKRKSPSVLGSAGQAGMSSFRTFKSEKISVFQTHNVDHVDCTYSICIVYTHPFDCTFLKNKDA